MRQSERAYEKIGLDQLLIYIAFLIEQRGEELSLEKLVAESFDRFPHRSQLRGYPHWPDSAKVGKSWLRCRTDRGWVSGSPQRGFLLTDAGRSEALRVKAEIEGSDPQKPVHVTIGYQRMVDQIRNSKGFEMYLAGAVHITEEALVDSLGAPLEASRVRLREQLRFAEDSAKTLQDDEVIAYLAVVKTGLDSRLRRDWKRK